MKKYLNNKSTKKLEKTAKNTCYVIMFVQN